jgi:hypothetical protein
MNNALPVLRPMSMGELLDQAIRLYRKNFFAFMGIIALVYIPISLITLVSTLIAGSAVSQTGLNQGAQGNPFLNPAYLSGLGGTLLSILLSAVFVRCLGTAALTRAIADNYLGKQVGILASYKSVGKSWLKLLGAVVLAGLIYVGVILFLIIPCIGWFTAPGLAVFLISVTLPMIAPVIVIEKTGASASLRRAWDLSRRRFWWLLGYVLILGLLSLVIVTGPAYLIRYLVSLIGGNTGNFVTQLQLQTD